MIKSVKVIFFMFSILFFIIFSSLIYFLVFKSEYYASHQLNRRIYENKNRFIRGRILDINGEILAYSQKDGNSQKRIYNYGEKILHPIGYFNEKYGMSGIEASMDKYLREPRGLVGNILKIFNYDSKLLGNDIKLTLNKDIQEYAYDILGDNKGSIVVMNPKTGEIYSMVSKPSFNPNYINEIWEDIINDQDAPFYNRSINGMYPPGSTFKVLTAAASIENIDGILKRRFLDNGFISFNKREKLYNQNERAYGNIDFKSAFINSSNVVFGNLALELGNDLFKDYVEKFYFNRDLKVEGFDISKSYFPDLDENEIGLIAQSGIGQGDVLATPIIMGMIVNAVVNNGILRKPYIISEILNFKSNILRKNKPQILSRVMESSTSAILKKYMKDVVSKNLYNIEELLKINAGGKTGTADYKKDGIDGIPHSWFIGFAPYDNPIISIAVIIEEGGEGRGIASYVAGKVMEMSLSLLE